MKIGIVTLPLHNNYGGLLQNYALQYVLKKMGHDVKTIDFVFKNSFFRYLLSSIKLLILSLSKFRIPVLRRFNHIYRKPLMGNFVRKNINTTKCCDYYDSKILIKEAFDAVIVGSDQVWRPQYNKYLEDMFLRFVPDQIRKIAYAASFGVDYWEYNDEQTRICANLAQRFSAISVREESGIELCKEHLHVDAQCVLDPTILAGAEAYRPLIKPYDGNPYLFAYILDLSPEKEEYVKYIAQSKGLEVRINSADQNATLSVEEWLSMIANATMVITDSFHGTVFSILFHREFYSIVNKERGGTRFYSLLSPLGLEDRLGDIEDLKKSRNEIIEWEEIDKKISTQRTDNINFIEKSLRK